MLFISAYQSVPGAPIAPCAQSHDDLVLASAWLATNSVQIREVEVVAEGLILRPFTLIQLDNTLQPRLQRPGTQHILILAKRPLSSGPALDPSNSHNLPSTLTNATKCCPACPSSAGPATVSPRCSTDLWAASNPSSSWSMAARSATRSGTARAQARKVGARTDEVGGGAVDGAVEEADGPAGVADGLPEPDDGFGGADAGVVGCVGVLGLAVAVPGGGEGNDDQEGEGGAGMCARSAGSSRE
ncbi:unnamed protein product [Parascedosporium putredinis]|uniref:Uncharacterized protein n=1 Tax=Parascedosporium putredinis TaxID=1442378 RepID=A0A9P1HA56_9PEZI|nr:unnamed protein product [Parascedosporium putredinis]CAI8004248.1 unnamed protein product [Parascedosporium putredinis]